MAIDQYDNEVNIMKVVNHENILKMIDFNKSANILEPNAEGTPTTEVVRYIALELCINELLEFINLTGKFNEPLARFYFR